MCAGIAGRTAPRSAGSTLRNLRNDIKHLKEAFGDVKLAELTEELVTEWYYGPHPNGEWQFRSECIRLKMLLREACAPGSKGAPPLLAENPFTLPIPPEPEAGSSDIPPVTPDELYHIYNAMLGYTRLSVYLAACAGGMRIGEVCGLMDTDFDLENKVLMIRRSVSHGADDLGPSLDRQAEDEGVPEDGAHPRHADSVDSHASRVIVRTSRTTCSSRPSAARSCVRTLCATTS